MEKRRKYLCSLLSISCALSLFWFSAPVSAQVLQSDPGCPNPLPPGKIYAVFGTTNENRYTAPSALPSKCIAVTPGQATVSFDALASAGIFNFSWALADVAKQRQTCIDHTAFEDIDFSDSQANTVQYELRTTIFNSDCLGANLARTGRDVLFRYGIQPEGEFGEQLYVYFKGFFPSTPPVPAPTTPTVVPLVVCGDLTSSVECVRATNCFWVNNACNSKTDRTICPSLNPENCAFSQACEWDRTSNRCISRLENVLGSQNGKPEGYKGPITDCAFKGTCRDLNDLLDLGIQIAKYLFGFLGTVALGFFVYGGFLITASMGNSEKVSEGKGVLVAAVMGIIVCFAAYAAVNFLLDLLQVGPEFRIIGN